MSQYERAALLQQQQQQDSGGSPSPTSSNHRHHQQHQRLQPNPSTSGGHRSQPAMQQQQQQPQHHNHNPHHRHYQQQQQQQPHFSSDEEADHPVYHNRHATTSAAAATSAPTDWSSGSGYSSTTTSDTSAYDSDGGAAAGRPTTGYGGGGGGRRDSDTTDSYTPDWEQYVQPDGSLFYIEYDCQPVAAAPTAATATAQQPDSVHAATDSNKPAKLNRSATRRSSGGAGNRRPISKLSTLMTRNLRGLGAVVGKQSSAAAKQGAASAGTTSANANAAAHPAQSAGPTSSAAAPTAPHSTVVKFSEIAEGELKLLRCVIDPAQRHKFGRRASVPEALLGVSVSPFADGRRLMIAGHQPWYSPWQQVVGGGGSGVSGGGGVGDVAGGSRQAKVGDWLKAIDGVEVLADNIDAVLLGVARRTEVLVTLQRMSGERQPGGVGTGAGVAGPSGGLPGLAAATEAAAVAAAAAAAAALSLNRVCSWSEMVANGQQLVRAEASADEGGIGGGGGRPTLDGLAGMVGQKATSPMVLAVMYLTLKDLNDTSPTASTSSAAASPSMAPDAPDVLFCYPERDQNVLYTARGSFLTLNSLLLDEMRTTGPQLTIIEVHGHRYHVVYRPVDGLGAGPGAGCDAPADCSSGGSDVLLVALGAAYASTSASRARAAELAQAMQFVHQKLALALTNPANHERWSRVCSMVSMLVRLAPHAERLRMLEAQLPESHWLPLPKDAQLRIDDALGEMEAMDYREWNGRPLQSHREFYVVGSALWWSGYLLATHLPAADLLDVEVYLRVHGVLRMLEVRAVREMLVWQEVYPGSVERGLVQQNYAYGIPQGRWFLACVARGQMLLAVLLEARHDSDLLVPHITPSPFYIEEIQDTFELLKTGGIDAVAETWSRCNKRPQVLSTATTAATRPPFPDAPMPVGTASELAASTLAAAAGAQQTKKAEIISILKRRNNSVENVGAAGAASSALSDESVAGKLMLSLQGGGGGGGGGSSVNSATFSEDSNHDDSDSDWDGFPDSQRSSSGYELSDRGATAAADLLRDVSDVLPGKITAGPGNVLYHYVHIDCGQGVFVAAPGRTPTDPIMQAFRRTCLHIHEVLQNTVRARYILAQAQVHAAQTQPTGGLSASQRPLVAIKEHGVLIEMPGGAADEAGGQTESVEFWVIGRLFQSPPKELYVCHRADVPQNMVELAFRLSMATVG